MLASIDSASHWVVLAKDIERFRCDLPILPLNENIVSRTLVFWIGSPKRTFVTDDMLEVPGSITFFVLMLLFVLLNVVSRGVLSMRIKSRSDIGSMDNLESVVRQNFKGHGVSDRLADTDEASAFLT
jgi:hypothetical protein